MKSLVRWLKRCIWHLTALESAVLDSVVAALPGGEGGILRAQIQAADFRRGGAHKVVAFSFAGIGNDVPGLSLWVGCSRQAIATVRVFGLASRFSTIASVIVQDGRLAELHFAPIAWSGPENYLVECQLTALPPGAERPSEAPLS